MTKTKKIHFIGICGTLMGNSAVYFKTQGFEVRGSDSNFYPPISNLLKDNNLKLYKGFKESNLDWNPDIVVIGNAMSRGNEEVEYVLNNKLNYYSLPQVLSKYFIDKKNSIVVTGTHGKTTTTAILSNIFSNAKKYPSYMIGGVAIGKSSGFKFERSGKDVILEGDEYDTAFFDKRSKFLHYKPDFLIINNIEFDHSDIFDNIEQIKLTFKRVINIVPKNGYIIANTSSIQVQNVINELIEEKKIFSNLVTFGTAANCDYKITNILHKENKSFFEIKTKTATSEILKFETLSCGEYQIFNFTASIITSLLNKIPLETIKKSISQFQGVKRRFEFIGKINNADIYEDFAHHPTAIKNVLLDMKRRYKDNKILALFEPRSNTSKKNIFQNEFTDSLSVADEVILGKLDREHLLKENEKLNIDKLILDLADNGTKASQIKDPKEIFKKLNEILNKDYVCLIMTNGSFDGLFNFIKK